MFLSIKIYFSHVGLQAHPEFLTRPLKPSPPYLGLLLAAAGGNTLKHYLSTGEIKLDLDEDHLSDDLEKTKIDYNSSSFDAEGDH